MKKNYVILIILSLIIGCIFTLIVTNMMINQKTTETMVIKKGSLTNTSVTIIIKDNNSNHIYGEWFKIEEEINEKWQEVPHLTDNISWLFIGYQAGKSNEIEIEEDWSNIYGELESGKYRIVKDYVNKNGNDRFYVYAEFIIE